MDSILGTIREMEALGWEPAGILATVRSVLEAEERAMDRWCDEQEIEQRKRLAILAEVESVPF